MINSGPEVSNGARWNLQLDERSNSLIVTAPKNKIQQIASLIQVFDVPLEGGRLQERIFTLKFVDRATIERAVKLVLPRFDAKKQMLDVKRSDSASSGSSSGAGK